MLIAWQTLNAVRRPGSKHFTRGFLIVAPGSDDPRSPARPAAERSGQLLRHPRAGPARPARGHEEGAHRHHELPRLQAPRPDGAVGRRTRAAAGRDGARAADARDRRPDAPARDARADGHEADPGAQRRGAPLLPREAAGSGRRSAEGRRAQGSREEQRGRAVVGVGPRSRQSHARTRSASSISRRRRSFCAAPATPKARSSPGR